MLYMYYAFWATQFIFFKTLHKTLYKKVTGCCMILVQTQVSS